MGDTEQTQGAVDLTQTVAKHYNELQEAGLQTRTQSRIFFLRNFNNWIKSVQIGETLQLSRRESDRNESICVLDLCCGKGGDLLKWKKGRISKLVCADIAETSVEQCESRYNEMVERNKRDRYPSHLFTAEFIAADCTKTRLKDVYKDDATKFDVVSCQFSFHYCFESFPQAHMMLRNSCECLRLGGYFIGTTPNSYEIVKRLKSSENKSFGNDVFSVTYAADDLDDPPLYGAKYDFHLEGVVDCPEFLVYFPVLEKMAEEFGMKLLYAKPFADFFKENVERGDHRSLLGKMQALEPYPPAEGTESASKDLKDYVNASDVIKELEEADDRPDHVKRRDPRRIGTLSQAEWEATTIYLAFAFQKVCDPITGEQWQSKEKDEEKRKRKSDTSLDSLGQQEKETKVT